MLHVYLRRSTDAYVLLTDALARHGIAPLPPIARTTAGKPYFPDHPNLHFNLSHSGEFSLCALGDGPVGVDVEQVRPRRPGLPAYCFTDGELADYQARGGDWNAFCEIWTLKEAWCKYLGVGLGAPKGWPTPPDCPHRSYGGNGFRAAVCAGEAPPQLEWL